MRPRTHEQHVAAVKDGDPRLWSLYGLLEAMCEWSGVRATLTSSARPEDTESPHGADPLRAFDVSINGWPPALVHAVSAAINGAMVDPRGLYFACLIEAPRACLIPPECRRLPWVKVSRKATGPHLHVQVFPVLTPKFPGPEKITGPSCDWCGDLIDGFGVKGITVPAVYFSNSRDHFSCIECAHEMIGRASREFGEG